MDVINQLLGGFGNALSPSNLAVAFIGVFLGTLVGVLPGLGPTSALAILLPLTAVLSPTTAIIMMAGIYYGAMYGGSTTAILLNIPGEVASVATTLDGYAMAKQGRAGPALAVSAIGSFVAGTFGVIGLTFFAPLLAEQALRFGPPEYAALIVLALTIMVSLSGPSLIRGLAAGGFGFVIAMVGISNMSTEPRLTFGFMELGGGVDLISVAIGMFAVAEIILAIEESRKAVAIGKIGRLFPSRKDLKQSAPAMCRGGVIGFIMGLLPGCSPGLTTFLAYDIEKKVSRHPEQFGKGAIEGVAAPESANNGTSSAGFIPLFALGIPASPPLAVLLGGLMIYGLQPGPMLFQQHSEFVWTVIASMYIGNIMLLVLNLPLVGIWARLTTVPFGVMAPIILVLCIIGSYSVRNSLFDVFITFLFGVLGYFFRKFNWPIVPFVLAFMLEPMLEETYIQSINMAISGTPVIFFTRPISLTLIILALALLVVSVRIKRRDEIRSSMGADSEA